MNLSQAKRQNSPALIKCSAEQTISTKKRITFLVVSSWFIKIRRSFFSLFSIDWIKRYKTYLRKSFVCLPNSFNMFFNNFSLLPLPLAVKINAKSSTINCRRCIRRSQNGKQKANNLYAYDCFMVDKFKEHVAWSPFCGAPAPVSAFSQSCLLSSRSEKSIIKTLQSQQKQFMEEKQRREERNEGILRSLDRIDYQASSLAAKTERLRTLKVRACNMKN